MKQLNLLTNCIAIGVIFVAMSSPIANAQQLGAATAYNLFIFDNAIISNTDAEGRIAIGGNASFNNYGVAPSLGNGANGSDTLVVGGNLNWSNGQLYYGNGKVGGAISTSGVGIPNGSITNGSPVNFSTARTDLLNESSYLHSLSTTGVINNSFGTVTLTGNSNSLNVFNLTEAMFENANTINIVTNGASTTLINVAGDHFDFFSGAIMINGTQNLRSSYNSKLLWNFYGASSLTDNSTGWNGSILAPTAAVTLGFTQINGTLIAQSLSGNGEMHWLSDQNNPNSSSFQFNGVLPTGQTSVPEPGLNALLAAVLLSGSIFVIRRRQKL